MTVLGTGDFFGEKCLTGQTTRYFSVTAMMDTVLIRLEKSLVAQLIHTGPELAEIFIAHLLGRAVRTEESLVDQLFNSSEKRLARLLLLMANFGQSSAPVPIIAKISQETLAEMVGTTRSRISFFMNRFRKLGYIDYSDHIEIHGSLLNIILHDKPDA